MIRRTFGGSGNNARSKKFIILVKALCKKSKIEIKEIAQSRCTAMGTITVNVTLYDDKNDRIIQSGVQ